MDLFLSLEPVDQMIVYCDGKYSHKIDVVFATQYHIHPDIQSQLFENPAAFGKKLFEALFPQGSLSFAILQTSPDRILLIADSEILERMPWEYLYDSNNFLALQIPFLRGLPPEKQHDGSDPIEGLEIVSVFSNPIDPTFPALNIESEWQRLKDVFQEINNAVILTRVRPPTLAQLGLRLAKGNNKVIHFSGHGGQKENQAFLCFEDEAGNLQPIGAQDFLIEVKGQAILAVISACVSATPGKTEFNNLAKLLVNEGLPYSLGMRFSIVESDALIFTRILYEGLASGMDIEKAVFRTRRELARVSPRKWAFGVPVLYTSLSHKIKGFPVTPGNAEIHDHQPPIDLSVLPLMQGSFQGRIQELKTLGKWMTCDIRPRLITIRGIGGQGKTALAREAATRFAWAWPGGVYAISLENVLTKDDFLINLSELIQLPTAEKSELRMVEQQLLSFLSTMRTLLILDNAESLVEAVEAGDKKAIVLAAFLRDSIPTNTVLLATSRRHFGWVNESSLELDGLSPAEGGNLFLQSIPQRYNAVAMIEAEALSERLGGHPLSLRLLGLTFNSTMMPFLSFKEKVEEFLATAEDKYQSLDHRQRSLFACLDVSTVYLDKPLLDLLEKLSIFRAPFPIQVADFMFNEEKGENDNIQENLYSLWEHGFLTLSRIMDTEEYFDLFSVPPTIRLYIERVLSNTDIPQDLLERQSKAYINLLVLIITRMENGSIGSRLASECSQDIERVINSDFLKHNLDVQITWGHILLLQGKPDKARDYIEPVLEEAQNSNNDIEGFALFRVGQILDATGQMDLAIRLYKQAIQNFETLGNNRGKEITLGGLGEAYRKKGLLKEALNVFKEAEIINGGYESSPEPPSIEQINDLRNKSAVLSNIGLTYIDLGQIRQAIDHLQAALEISTTIGNRFAEATILNNLGLAYQANNIKSREAMSYFTRSLLISRDLQYIFGEATSLNNIALFLQQNNKAKEALAYLEEVLELHRRTKNKLAEGETLNNIGMVYSKLDQPKKALPLLKQALEVARQCGNILGEAVCLNNLGNIYHENKNYTEAIKVLHEAADIFKKTGNVRAYASCLFSLAQNLSDGPGKVTEAMLLLQESIDLLESNGLSEDASGISIVQRKNFLENLRNIDEFFPIDGVSWGQISENEVNAVGEFINPLNTPDKNRAQAFIIKYKNNLLNIRAFALIKFQIMVAKKEKQHDLVFLLEDRLLLLRRCDQVGVDAAFKSINQPETGDQKRNQRKKIRHHKR